MWGLIEKPNNWFSISLFSPISTVCTICLSYYFQLNFLRFTLVIFLFFQFGYASTSNQQMYLFIFSMKRTIYFENKKVVRLNKNRTMKHFTIFSLLFKLRINNPFEFLKFCTNNELKKIDLELRKLSDFFCVTWICLF